MVGAHLVPIKVCFFALQQVSKIETLIVCLTKTGHPKTVDCGRKKSLQNSASKKYAQNNQGTSTFFNQTSIFSGFEIFGFPVMKVPIQKNFKW